MNGESGQPLAEVGLKSIATDYFVGASNIRLSKEQKEGVVKLTKLDERFGNLLAESTCCKDCGKLIGDEAEYCFCPGCKHMVCGHINDGGCRKMQWCDSCDLQRCTKCVKMVSCRSCAEEYCCQTLIACGECNMEQCDYCAYNASVNTYTCSSCDLTRCSECRVMDFCDQCEGRFCRGLHGVMVTCSGK